MFSFFIVALGSMGRQQTYGFMSKLRARVSQLPWYKITWWFYIYCYGGNYRIMRASSPQ